MWLSNYRLTRFVAALTRRPSPIRRHERRIPLTVEQLEDRNTPATLDGRRPPILRLTRTAGTYTTIKLEGKLLGPWVDEVRQACAASTDPFKRISLDLSTLIFLDAAGEELLRDLIGRGIELVACSGYVAELLRSRGT